MRKHLIGATYVEKSAPKFGNSIRGNTKISAWISLIFYGFTSACVFGYRWFTGNSDYNTGSELTNILLVTGLVHNFLLLVDIYLKCFCLLFFWIMFYITAATMPGLICVFYEEYNWSFRILITTSFYYLKLLKLFLIAGYYGKLITGNPEVNSKRKVTVKVTTEPLEPYLPLYFENHYRWSMNGIHMLNPYLGRKVDVEKIKLYFIDI